MFSDTAEYALRATLYIAQQTRDGRAVRAEDVAAALSVPRNYLSKILHVLARNGVLRSARGPAGGFRLAEDPDTVAIHEVIRAFESLEPRSCILGRAECSDLNPCPAHHRWKRIADGVNSFLRGTTVGDLLREEGSLT
jgi:Rrf2 family protein